MSENPVYLKTKQITKIYGFSRNTWLSWVDSGHAPAGITFSKRVTVWDKKDVDAFVERCRQAGRGAKK